MTSRRLDLELILGPRSRSRKWLINQSRSHGLNGCPCL